MDERVQKYLPLGCVFLVAPFLVCGMLLYIPVATHNTQLEKFASNLYTYPLPAETVVISRQEEVGLMGNGNHCDFLVEQTMATHLTSQAIESYYQDVELPGAVVESSSELIHVEFNKDLPIDGKLLFTISIFDFGNSTNLDFRCH